MKKGNKVSRKWYLFISLVLVFSFLSSGLAFAESDIKTEIYINGCKLETDVEPVIKDGSTFVPIRAIGEALGYTFTYDETAKAIDMAQSDMKISIKMAIDSKEAYVNGEQTAMPAAPFIVEGRTMVPVRFISEALDSRVIWQEGYANDYVGIIPNKVAIYCSYPIKLHSGNARIASQIYGQSWSLQDTDGAEKTVRYDVVIPVFSEMKDADFQQELNSRFQEIHAYAVQEMGGIYDEQKDEAIEYKYNASYDYTFSIISDYENILSIISYDYYYTGGAHGMPGSIGVNIDFKNSKILGLADLFEPEKDYEQKLLDEMKAIQKLSSTQEYADVDEVTELPAKYCFYFEGGDLVIFYHPYELSYYARGFVEFRIPLENLADYLKDEYKAL